MANYSENWRSYTTGSQPSGWYNGRGAGTSLSSVTPMTALVQEGAGGLKYLEVTVPSTSTGAAAYFMMSAPDSDSSRNDVEVLALVRFVSGEGLFGIGGRFTFGTQPSIYSGAAEYDTGYTGPTSYNRKVVNNVYSNLSSNTYVTGVGPTEWFYIRFQLRGTALKLRTWARGTAEPSTWKAETTDTSLSGVGAVGIHWEKYTAPDDFKFQIAYFAVGTSSTGVATLDTPAIIEDALHSQTVDSPRVDVPGDPGYTILGGWGSSVWGLSYPGSGSNLSQPEIGAIQTTHTVTSDNVTLIEDVAVIAQESTHGLTSDSPSLVVEKYLVVQDALHTTSSDNAAVKANAIVPQKSTHSHTAESPVIIQSQVILAQEATHATSSETPTLSQDYHLSTNDSIHQVSSDIPNILQDFWLLAQESTHTVSSDNGRVYISFEPGTIDTGEFTPRTGADGAPYEEGALVASGEYTPRARTSGQWEEAEAPTIGSWNST